MSGTASFPDAAKASAAAAQGPAANGKSL